MIQDESEVAAPAKASPRPFSPLALRAHRSIGPVVGRPIELEAIEREIAVASGGRIAALALEGEPGIGKTRLLLAAREAALERGLTAIAVAADEELRGPFLLARSILGSAEAIAAADSPDAEEALGRCLEALSGQDDPSVASMSPDQRLLRTYDQGAVAVRELAARRPLALLIDDLQWADDDSLRLLRYVIRADAADPIFLMFAIRPEELALVTEAVNLVADMDRMGLVRRLRLHRFTQLETKALLEQVLGGPVYPASAAAMHAQAEGVPFIVEEMAHAYRDGRMIQEIDDVWTLAGNAEQLVPSAVRTLISRRAAHLPAETKEALAIAALLGRRFSLKDLREVELRIDGGVDPNGLAEALAPAVGAGLLLQQGDSSAADYSFAHEQIRDFATAGLTPERRRSIHSAIVELLLVGEPSPESLPLLAHHAKAAGDGDVCVSFSIRASHNALAANAPEEVLRVIELSLPLAATSQERVELLEARDRALDMLRRSDDRMEGLAELAALAEALGDADLELDVRLRRAAALRTAEESDRAASLAAEVRERARAEGLERWELAACVELGQDLLRSSIGEGYVPPANEVDLDAAEEPYRRAAELARALGDEALLAAVLRELGVIQIGRTRAWFIERVNAGDHVPIARRVAAGEVLEDILPELPIAPLVEAASELFAEALEIFERLGDRRGSMATIIAMGYLSWAPDIHLGSGSARHIEEIRRLVSGLKAFTNESERAAFEAQLLYGVHVFARAKVIPDLALSRGELAHRTARDLGDRSIEFLAAGGTAMSHLDLGDLEAAGRWLATAAAVASQAPSPLRARRLESWRGLADAVGGDADGMREHLERAVEMASESGLPAARCEELARLALAASKLGVERNDPDVLDLAERSARGAADLTSSLPGHPPWGAQADAALARIEMHRGHEAEALEHARSALEALRSAMREDLNLEVVAPISAVFRAADADEWEFAREFLQLSLAMIAQRTIDEDVRVRWFRGPVGRELTEMAGPLEAVSVHDATPAEHAVDEQETALLHSLIQGKTNAEIAHELGVAEDQVTRRLGELFSRIGASNRAEATAFAFRERVV